MVLARRPEILCSCNHPGLISAGQMYINYEYAQSEKIIRKKPCRVLCDRCPRVIHRERNINLKSSPLNKKIVLLPPEISE